MKTPPNTVGVDLHSTALLMHRGRASIQKNTATNIVAIIPSVTRTAARTSQFIGSEPFAPASYSNQSRSKHEQFRDQFFCHVRGHQSRALGALRIPSLTAATESESNPVTHARLQSLVGGRTTV